MPTALSTKQKAFSLFEQERSEFLAHARRVARELCEKRGIITIDDVREEVQCPSWFDARVFGAVFRTDDWVKVGYTQTSIASSHGRPVAQFTLRKPIVRGQLSFF